MFYRLSADYENFRRLAYQVKVAPPAIVQTNINASFMAGGSFITGPHCKMKWAMGLFVSPYR